VKECPWLGFGEGTVGMPVESDRGDREDAEDDERSRRRRERVSTGSEASGRKITRKGRARKIWK
jgi:hypothetical protein